MSNQDENERSNNPRFRHTHSYALTLVSKMPLGLVTLKSYLVSRVPLPPFLVSVSKIPLGLVTLKSYLLLFVLSSFFLLLSSFLPCSKDQILISTDASFCTCYMLKILALRKQGVQKIPTFVISRLR